MLSRQKTNTYNSIFKINICSKSIVKTKSKRSKKKKNNINLKKMVNSVCVSGVNGKGGVGNGSEDVGVGKRGCEGWEVRMLGLGSEDVRVGK